jgi:cyclophilin family peptidyl-prolyl cis-trans isomerase
VGTAKRERQKAGRQARLQQLQQTQKRRRTTKVVRNVVLVVVGLVVVAFVLSRFVGNSNSTVATDTTIPATSAVATTLPPGSVPATKPFVFGIGPCPAADGSSPVTKKFTQAPKECIDPKKTYTAKFDTSEGEIDIALDAKKTPGTTNNFVVLSRYHYYDGTIIFRTDTSIDIIQGGGMTNVDTPGYTIPDEGANYTYAAGDIAMARSSSPNSAGGQFFIITGPKAALLNTQGTYVVFGKITTGLDIAQKIIGLNKTDPASQLGGAPSRTVTINKITIVEA